MSRYESEWREDSFRECEESGRETVRRIDMTPWIWNNCVFCIRDCRNVFDYCYGIPTFDTWDCGFWW